MGRHRRLLALPGRHRLAKAKSTHRYNGRVGITQALLAWFDGAVMDVIDYIAFGPQLRVFYTVRTTEHRVELV